MTDIDPEAQRAVEAHQALYDMRVRDAFQKRIDNGLGVTKAEPGDFAEVLHAVQDDERTCDCPLIYEPSTGGPHTVKEHRRQSCGGPSVPAPCGGCYDCVIAQINHAGHKRLVQLLGDHPGDAGRHTLAKLVVELEGLESERNIELVRRLQEKDATVRARTTALDSAIAKLSSIRHVLESAAVNVSYVADDMRRASDPIKARVEDTVAEAVSFDDVEQTADARVESDVDEAIAVSLEVPEHRVVFDPADEHETTYGRWPERMTPLNILGAED
jgi:hypothetical protein